MERESEMEDERETENEGQEEIQEIDRGQRGKAGKGGVLEEKKTERTSLNVRKMMMQPVDIFIPAPVF